MDSINRTTLLRNLWFLVPANPIVINVRILSEIARISLYHIYWQWRVVLVGKQDQGYLNEQCVSKD